MPSQAQLKKAEKKNKAAVLLQSNAVQCNPFVLLQPVRPKPQKASNQQCQVFGQLSAKTMPNPVC